jgi:dihydroneopterin aldolase
VSDAQGATPLSCSIALRDIQVQADIGVHHHEVGRPQPLIVHVALAVLPPERDLVEHVFNYVAIKALAEDLALQRIVLIESFARRLAEACLEHRLVLGAAVTVEKPRAVPGSMASATIRAGSMVTPSVRQ